MSSMIESGQRLTRRTKTIALVFVVVFIAAAIYYSRDRPKRDEVLIPCGGWQHDAGSTNPPRAPVTPNGTPLIGSLSSNQLRPRC